MLLGMLCPLLGALLLGLSPVLAEEERTHGSVPLRTHSLQIPFLDSDLQSRWFDYGGDTIIRADRYVRLASDQPSHTGWVFSRVPLTATNWEIELEFSIHGKNNLFGDGMGMFLTKQRAVQGTVFGMQDRFEGLGIFIDTYKNNRPGVIFPYVMAMMGDGNTPYDKDNDGKANELAGCSARGLRNTDFPTKMKVTYFAEQSLKVDLLYKKEDEWTPCFEVPNVKLPSVTYLGLTAETGELSDNFDIYRMETRNLYSHGTGNLPHGKTSPFGKGASPKAPREGGSWTWFFLKFIIFGLALAGAYVGFTMYRASRRDRF
ncbi:L-type lectin-like domain-containing protein [Elsinoe fawcettii]|nr:L-type lectin-like domain-containing protein [Elsinoe fawcettii]